MRIKMTSVNTYTSTGNTSFCRAVGAALEFPPRNPGRSMALWEILWAMEASCSLCL